MECLSCGIVFAKWAQVQARRGPHGPRVSGPTEAPPGPPAPPSSRRFRHPFSKVCRRDLCLSLSQLLASGNTLQASLGLLIESSSTGLRDELQVFRQAVTPPVLLSEAMTTAPRLFRPSDVATLRSFEASGHIEQGFSTLAAGLSESIALRKQLIRSLLYPFFVLLAHIVISPLPTLVTGTVTSYIWAVTAQALLVGAILLLLFVVLPTLMEATPAGPYFRRMAWHFPWPATLYRHHIRGTFCGVLSRNLAAGLEVTAAVRGAAASTSDERCQESGEKVVQAIARGSELVPALLATGLARPTEGLVLRAGERSGELVDSLREVAERYAEFRTRGLKTLMVVLGALLTIVVVVWVVLGVLESYSGILGGGDDLLERIDREAFPG